MNRKPWKWPEGKEKPSCHSVCHAKKEYGEMKIRQDFYPPQPSPRLWNRISKGLRKITVSLQFYVPNKHAHHSRQFHSRGSPREALVLCMRQRQALNFHSVAEKPKATEPYTQKTGRVNCDMLPAIPVKKECCPTIRPSVTASRTHSGEKQDASPREGNGTPLQSSCLENPMDGGAW